MKYFVNYIQLRIICHDLLRGGFNEEILNSNFRRKTFLFSKKKDADIISGYQSFNINKL